MLFRGHRKSFWAQKGIPSMETSTAVPSTVPAKVGIFTVPARRAAPDEVYPTTRELDDQVDVPDLVIGETLRNGDRRQVKFDPIVIERNE